MRNWTSLSLILPLVTALIAGLHYCLCLRLARVTALDSWRRTGVRVFALGTILLPAGIILPRVLSGPASTSVATFSFKWLGLLLLFMTLASGTITAGTALLEVARALPKDSERRSFVARLLSGLIGIAAVGVGVYGVVGADGPKVVQLTDLHVAPAIDGDWLRVVVARANALEPDVMAITRDLVDVGVDELRVLAKLDKTLLAGLHRLDDTLIYTSCGTGYWGPPMRVGASAELSYHPVL